MTDFEVSINDEVRTFEQFYDAMDWIIEKTAQWNNFQPELDLYIKLRKVPNGIDTLGVSVEEEIRFEDRFGG